MSSSDCPQLVYVDPAGCRRSVTLSGQSLVTLGRRPEADVCLPWDPEISRVHAELLHRSGEWIVIDDGLSQNGTLVNGCVLKADAGCATAITRRSATRR